jgi:hypothetical protein
MDILMIRLLTRAIVRDCHYLYGTVGPFVSGRPALIVGTLLPRPDASLISAQPVTPCPVSSLLEAFDQRLGLTMVHSHTFLGCIVLRTTRPSVQVVCLLVPGLLCLCSGLYPPGSRQRDSRAHSKHSCTPNATFRRVPMPQMDLQDR